MKRFLCCGVQEEQEAEASGKKATAMSSKALPGQGPDFYTEPDVIALVEAQIKAYEAGGEKGLEAAVNMEEAARNMSPLHGKHVPQSHILGTPLATFFGPGIVPGVGNVAALGGFSGASASSSGSGSVSPILDLLVQVFKTREHFLAEYRWALAWNH